MKIALVGLGSIAKCWINAIECVNGTELVAVCDILNKDQKYPFYQNFQEMIDKEKFDTVVISTPPSTHVEIVKTSLQRKKNVIVEKPFSTRISDLEECIKIAKENNVILYLAYHSVFGATYQKAKKLCLELLSQGDKIISASANFKYDVRLYHSGHSWIFDSTISGGGALADTGINMFSIVLDLLGPLEINTVSLVTPEDQKVEREFMCTFTTSEGKPVSIYNDWLSTEKPPNGLFTFDFLSGSKIEFEWISGEINKYQNSEKCFSLIEEKDSDMIPMDVEYINMLEDSLKHITKEKVQLFKNNDAFCLTMKCYEKFKNQ